MPHDDSKVIHAWHLNAAPWTKAVRNQEIESRNLVTNAAVINAILNPKPTHVLDIGCGEGWLTRELSSKGISAFGIDGVPSLIEQARKMGGGQFDTCTYEDLPEYKFAQRFDCAVCNFSLIGKEATEMVLESARNALEPKGRLIIQTPHPLMASLDTPYEDGWRAGSWAGFSKDFTEPAPWYFRTMESWVKLLGHKGFQVHNIFEPMHPKTGKPASIIFESYVDA